MLFGTWRTSSDNTHCKNSREVHGMQTESRLQKLSNKIDQNLAELWAGEFSCDFLNTKISAWDFCLLSNGLAEIFELDRGINEN